MSNEWDEIQERFKDGEIILKEPFTTGKSEGVEFCLVRKHNFLLCKGNSSLELVKKFVDLISQSFFGNIKPSLACKDGLWLYFYWGTTDIEEKFLQLKDQFPLIEKLDNFVL